MNQNWMMEFLRSLMNPCATDDEIQHAFELKNNNLPKTLYRYRPAEEYSIKELETDAVYMNIPENQNDPLDSTFTVSEATLFNAVWRANMDQWAIDPDMVGYLTEEDIQYCMKSDNPMEATINALAARISPMELQEFHRTSQILRHFVSTQVREIFLPKLVMFRNAARICCFTTDYQSAVMWGNYSQTHRGFCIAYEIASLPIDDLRRRWLYPVVYTDTPFDATPYFASTIEKQEIHVMWGTLACIHKRVDWSYEKEWRIVMPLEKSSTPLHCPLVKPAGVYIGQGMSPEYQRKVEEVTNRRGIPTFKMTVSYPEGRMIASRP